MMNDREMLRRERVFRATLATTLVLLGVVYGLST